MSVWHGILVERTDEPEVDRDLLDTIFTRSGDHRGFACHPEFQHVWIGNHQPEQYAAVLSGHYFEGGGKGLDEEEFVKNLARVVTKPTRVYTSWEGVENYTFYATVTRGNVAWNRHRDDMIVFGWCRDAEGNLVALETPEN